MIIKETPWEKRNLGVESSVEFYFEKNDDAEKLGDAVLNNKSYSYQIAHVPVGMVDLLNKLLANGFSFCETKIELTADLRNLSLPPVFERFSEGLSYSAPTEKEIDEIYQSMRDGVFSTDKVALDPHFSAEIAGHRYACWTNDIVKTGVGFIYLVKRGDEKLGYFILKKASDRLGDSFLAALFDREKDAGYGFSVLYFPMVEAKRMGLRKMITGVSSNNPDSVKMHMALGYQIKDMDYTLVKHI